jgi:hypothetical protein
MTTFNRGDRVRVDNNAPEWAGETGAVQTESAGDRMPGPGYWICLDSNLDTVWVPAEALTAEAGEPR